MLKNVSFIICILIMLTLHQFMGYSLVIYLATFKVISAKKNPLKSFLNNLVSDQSYFVLTDFLVAFLG